MRAFKLFLIGFCILFFCMATEVSAGSFLRDFPAWGASPSSVLQQRRPLSFIGAKTVGLLFHVPVYALLTEEMIDGHAVSVLYFFHEGRLIEFAVTFHEKEKDGSLYCELKNGIRSFGHAYEGDCFPLLEDRFADESNKSLYLLVTGEYIRIFALDLKLYSMHKSDIYSN